MNEKIAVIGTSCLFPGAKTPEEFWQNLIEQKDTTSLATTAEMGVDPKIFYDPAKGQTDKYYSLRGGYIRDFTFDPTGYAIPPETLESLDHIFKWSLYVAKAALRDSGYLDHVAARARCGVILGNLSFPTRASHHLLAPIYRQTVEASLSTLINQSVTLPSLPAPKNLSSYNAMTFGYPATVVAQALSLAAGHFALDSACASSLYAVKLACQYLLTGKADMMLAGAVSCADPFFINMGFSIFQAYPENGQFRPLDQSTAGLVAGEGAGMFVLKRYEDAIRDGDHIQAVIRGVGLSNDGRGKFLLSPRSKGQLLAFERAYAEAGIDPKTISYVECHATGTPLGDKTELETMDTFFGQHGASPLIGSVKSNFGHLLTTAGMASMLKVTLSMSKGVIPATINVDTPASSPNAVISSDQIVRAVMPWPQTDLPKRAAVSAFGFGGTNAHLIFEEGEGTGILPPPNLPLQGGGAFPSSPPVGGIEGGRTTQQPNNLPVKESPKSTIPPSGGRGGANPTPSLAITGMDAYFGGCAGLEAFNETIYTGHQHFGPVPSQRWKGIEQQPDILRQYGFVNGQAPEGAYIDKFDFDFLRFGIPPNAVDQPIPQHLLILKVADNALRDAAIQEGQNVAVIVATGTELSLHQFRGRCDLTWQISAGLTKLGITLSPNEQVELETIAKDIVHNAAQVNQYTSFIGNIMASRIAARWDFSGPALTICAEENATFKGLEVAQLLLGSGQVDAVLLGAVDLSGGVENVLLRQQMAPTNDGPPCLSYDQNAAGWLVGEGAGAIVLQRADRITASSSSTYAIIETMSLTHETTAQGLPTLPSADIIRHTCTMALAEADLQANEIQYLELFGSGVPAEDEVEINGLLGTYQSSPEAEPTCALGNIKSNIGHTFTASGMAALIKTALCLHHRYIPGTPNWSGPKQSDRWRNALFYVPSESRPWFSNHLSGKRRAALNGLGSDGSCAHLILSDVSTSTKRAEPAPSQRLNTSPPHLFLLTGVSEASLHNQLDQLQQQLNQTVSLSDLANRCWQSYQAQTQPAYTLALVGKTKEHLAQEIELACQGITLSFQQEQVWKTPAGSYFTSTPLGRSSKVAFVYPGAFNTYPGVGRELSDLFPRSFETILAQVPNLGEIIRQSLIYPRSMSHITEEHIKQKMAQLIDDVPAMLGSGIYFAWFFTHIMRKQFGLQPDAALGYSLGESTMMYALDVWSVQNHNHTRLQNSPLFRDRLVGPKNVVREHWGMLPLSIGQSETHSMWAVFIVKTAAEKIKAALHNEDRVYLTLINTPHEAVIAGDPAACQRVITALGCDYIQAPFNDTILHCEPMLSEYDEFVKLNTWPVQTQSDIDFYFAARETVATNLSTETIAHDIAAGACRQLDFPQLVERVYNDGVRIFIELGIRNTCTRWIDETLANEPHLAVSIDRRSKDDRTNLINLLAQLASHQVAVDLSPLYASPEIAEKQPKSLIKQVTLGGPRIVETILSELSSLTFGRSLIDPLIEGVSPPKGEEKYVDSPLWEVRWGNSASSQNGATQEEKIFTRPRITMTPKTNIVANIIEQLEYFSVAFNQAETYARQLTQAHQTFLRTRQKSLGQLAQLAQLQMETAAQMLQRQPATEIKSLQTNLVVSPQEDRKTSQSVPSAPPSRFESEAGGEGLKEIHPPKPVIWDEADLLEFAEGNISNVFGPEYAIIDTYARRVRLPMPPYLLVSRVTALTATPHQYEPCFIQTEYDIPADAWYAVAEQVPTAVAIESGQCDLLLISYLGIDFENKGHLIYRLLDCTLTFLDDLPKVGQTLRYDISINSFARSGDNLLFFFSYDCYVGDKMVLKMRGGCAGFFSDEDLAKGKGIIVSDKELAEQAQIQKQYFEPLLLCHKLTFDTNDLVSLSQGNLATCFGPHYDQQGLNPALRYPNPAMLMIDRVVSVDRQGGLWGLGEVIGEKDLAPDDWYFPCHFKDDEVLAGSLMAEGCIQLLQFYLLYLGLQTQTQDAQFQPIPGVDQVVRCRGQVTPQDSLLVYRLQVTDIGLTPQPYLKAKVEVILGDKVIVDFVDLSIQLVERGLNFPPSGGDRGGANSSSDRLSVFDIPQTLPPPSLPLQGGGAKADPLFTEYHITEFALGSIPNCFGPDFNIYLGRRTPRTPNGDLQLISRILQVNGERLKFDGKPSLVSEYDVSISPWFCEQNSYPVMPYSILMEIALQPCGFLSAYLGSTLPYADQDFYFRNLDGDGKLLRDVDLRGKIIRNDVILLSSTAIQGIIIQKFSYQLSTDGEPFFEGKAAFGYFMPEALINQVGLDGGQDILPWCQSSEQVPISVNLKDATQQHLYQVSHKPAYRLAQQQLNMLASALIMPQGGKAGQGYIYAQQAIDPQDWFFKAHFYEDPVMPGSLGVEAILQAMQVFALQQNLGEYLVNPHFYQVLDHQIVWKYRGQVTPDNAQYYLEVHITRIERQTGQVLIFGDASLWKPGMRIYEVEQVAIRLVEGHHAA